MSNQVERINFNVLKSHKVALRKLARIQGEPMSVVIRQLIREAALARGIWQDSNTSSLKSIVHPEENGKIPS